MENGHNSQSVSAERANSSPSSELYEKKYMALLKRCTTLQQNNEWLVNRLHHVKKLLRKIRHERRFLMRRLDSHQDRYADVPLILPTDPDLESSQVPPGIPADLLPFCSGSTTGEKRPSSKGSRGTQLGKASASAAVGTSTSSYSKITSKGNGKRKARSSKDKDRGSSKKSTLTKPSPTPSLSTLSLQQSQQCKRKDETYVRPIKVKMEDISNDVESKNWTNSATNSDNKKGYYDLYEHSYDLLQPATLDLGMNSVALRGNAGTLS